MEKSSQTAHNPHTLQVLPQIRGLHDVEGNNLLRIATWHPAVELSQCFPDSIMNNRMIIASTLLLGLTATFANQAECGQKRICQTTTCCPQPACKKCGGACAASSSASGPTTKWFKAKDGTIREVMTHWEALHRAVDADNMEIELKATQAELESTKSELSAVKEASAAQVASLEQQLADLKSQLEAKDKVVQNQKKRANTAEAAKKAEEEKVAGLTEAAKKS